MGPMCVTEDDDIRLGVELCQAAGNTLVGLSVVRQSQPLGDHVQDLEGEAKQARLVTVGEHDAPSGEV